MERLTKRQKNGDAMWARGGNICTPGYTQSRICETLCKYEDAEEAGKLVKLPIAIGEKLYTTDTNIAGEEATIEWTVKGYRLTPTGVMYIELDDDVEINSMELGVNIFLTDDKAKAARAKKKEQEKRWSEWGV